MVGRRGFMVGLAGMTGGLILGARGQAAGVDAPTEPASIEPVDLSQAEWQERLTDAEYRVLREAGTERPGSSPLNSETRPGTFVCAGCGLALFRSEWKYKSGTGWPSFFDVMKQHIGTREDNALFTTRTEYHCARCGGHQGHVFDDGPEPTGLRYCNNGVALKFKPSQQQA